MACCKAGDVAAKYGFREQLDEELGKKWELDDGPGLRRLAQEFNVLVIDSSLLNAGRPALEGEPEMFYELLTDDEIEDAERARVRQRLEDYGTDPNELTGDFISYRTIDRHFKNCTDRERSPTSDPITVKESLDRIRALRGRLERVAEKSLAEVGSQADNSTNLEAIDIFVQIDAVCEECNTRASLRTLLADGCRCSDATTDSDRFSVADQ